jgi:hydrogenase maturation protease
VVIGVGNALRGDDAAGLHAARRVRERPEAAGVTVLEHHGEPVALLDLWETADAVILVDAIHSGAEPGTLHRFDASTEPVPAGLGTSASTHAVCIAEAIELARAVHRLPRTVIVHGVEGRRFASGAELSDEVEAALGPLTDALVRELGGLAHDAARPR